MPRLCDYNILVTTSLGNESVAASYIEEECPGATTLERPLGFKGIVLVRTGEPEACIDKLLSEVSFVERIHQVKSCVEASIDKIASEAKNLAKTLLSSNDSFAIVTTRRGRHEFTSVEVNIHVGREVQLATGARVDLEKPDYAILVNIIGDTAFISIEKGYVARPKRWRDKPNFTKIFNRLTIVQEPYVSNDVEASYKMGERLGRALQTYEVGEYIIALTKPTPAIQLASFIQGVEEGVNSRYVVQEKSYSRKPHKTSLSVYEMHLAVRRYRGRPIIIFEPEGTPIYEAADRLADLILGKKPPLLVFGAREGVPTGLFRFADIVVDLAPGLTLSTDQVIPTALGALTSIIGGKVNQYGE